MSSPSRPVLSVGRRAEGCRTDAQAQLDQFVDDVDCLGDCPLGVWRGAALRGLADVRQLIVEESAPPRDPARARGDVILRERNVLLERLSLLRLQVLGVEEVDRISYDVKRLVVDVERHLEHVHAEVGNGLAGGQGGSE